MKVRRGTEIKVGPLRVCVSSVTENDQESIAEVHVVYGTTRLGSCLAVPLARLQELQDSPDPVL